VGLVQDPEKIVPSLERGQPSKVGIISVHAEDALCDDKCGPAVRTRTLLKPLLEPLKVQVRITPDPRPAALQPGDHAVVDQPVGEDPVAAPGQCAEHR